MYWLQVSAVSESHDQVKHKTYICTGDQRSDKGSAGDAVTLGMQHREAEQEIYIYINAYTVIGIIPWLKYMYCYGFIIIIIYI
jgi:hypothetical protein